MNIWFIYKVVVFVVYFKCCRVGVVQIYENGGFKGSYASSLIDGATYKVQRIGNTITYLVNDVVFHTSATTSSDNSLKSSTPPPFNKSSAIVGFVLII
jgi:hypothetical protein